MEQPKIPTLKDSQKPQVKIKGLAAGMSLFDRLKQFKKKDLAFILAGLGTLFMAPLAEHFMMAPESGDGTMQQGWGGKGGSNLFGSGSSPYESGITGLAPGGAIGGGGDVITPLNVRDPSALVMGPGMTQQPPAGSLAPQTAPPAASKEPDLKDALANAAARAAGAATRKAPVPVPKPAKTGSGLRGLGVASGGSSAGAGLAPINSAGLSTNKAAGSNSLSDVRPNSNYRGVARGPGSGSSADRLRSAGGNAADLFNQKGAASSLEQAAQVAMPGNGNAFGGGNGGSGKDDKGPGGNNSNGSKSVGESLEFLRQKQEMEKALDLKWKMKEKRAMFPLELQQEAAKAIVMDGVVKPLAGGFGELMKASFSPSSTQVFMCAEGNVPVSEVSMSGDRGCAGKKYYQSTDARGITLNRCGSDKSSGGGAAYTGCRLGSTGGAPGSNGPAPEQGLGGGDPYAAGAQGPTGYTGQSLTQICTKLRSTDSAFRPGPETTHLQNQSKRLAIAIEAMGGTGAQVGSGSMGTACGVAATDNILTEADRSIAWGAQPTAVANIRARQEFLKNNMLGGPTGAVTIMTNAADAWRAANSAAKQGVDAQADAAKAAAPDFTAVDQQITANLNNARTGSNAGDGQGGFASLTEERMRSLGAVAAKTGELLNRVQVPSDAELTQLNGTAMTLPAGGEAQGIVNDMKLIAGQQRTVLAQLQAEQQNYPARTDRAANAFRGGTALSGNVTALLSPAGAATGLGNTPLGAVGDVPAPTGDLATYGQVKQQITTAAQNAETRATDTSLGASGVYATRFGRGSTALGNQIGTGGQNGGTGWTASVGAIMGAAPAAAPTTTTPPQQ
jgi:hypothetical protein